MTDRRPHPDRPHDVLLDERPPPSQKAAGLVENAMGVLRRPADTFRELAVHPPLGQALVVVVVVVSLLATVQAMGVAAEPEAPLRLLPAAIVGGLFIGLPAGLVSFALWSAFVLGCAKLLGGTGTFRGTLTGLGFAYVPLVLGVLAGGLALGPAGGGVLAAALLAASLWSFALDVVAVREVHRLSTGRAVGAMVLPFALFAILVALLVVILFAALVTTT